MTTDIIERVRRLLALSRSSNVHEASAAFAAAQKLITRHNLDQAELEAAQGHGGDALVEVSAVDMGQHKQAWKLIVLDGLAKANNCRAYSKRFPGGRTYGMLFGTRRNCTTIQYLSAFVFDQIQKLWEEELERRRKEYGRSPRSFMAVELDRLRDDFLCAAADEVRSRVVDASKQAASEVETEGRGAALVLVTSELERLQAAYRELGVKSNPTRYVEDETLAAGRAAGRRVKLETDHALGSPAEQLEKGKP